jgi:hypothetical protein
MKSSREFTVGLLHFAATGDASKPPEAVEMPTTDWVVPEIEANPKIAPPTVNIA